MKKGVDPRKRAGERLACAVLGHLNGASPRIGGAGAFVAPGIAITARHVVRDLFRTDPWRADDLLARASGLIQMRTISHFFK